MNEIPDDWVKGQGSEELLCFLPESVVGEITGFKQMLCSA